MQLPTATLPLPKGEGRRSREGVLLTRRSRTRTGRGHSSFPTDLARRRGGNIVGLRPLTLSVFLPVNDKERPGKRRFCFQ